MDCLEGNGWELERAVANFEQVKVREIISVRVLYTELLLIRHMCLGNTGSRRIPMTITLTWYSHCKHVTGHEHPMGFGVF